MRVINTTDKITAVKTVADIPFTDGSAVHGRVRAVLTSKTVGAAIKKGARMSTVRYAVKHRLVRVAA